MTLGFIIFVQTTVWSAFLQLIGCNPDTVEPHTNLEFKVIRTAAVMIPLPVTLLRLMSKLTFYDK
jgi:hypothetical protein